MQKMFVKGNLKIRFERNVVRLESLQAFQNRQNWSYPVLNVGAGKTEVRTQEMQAQKFFTELGGSRGRLY